jgi:hypothetical protein
MRKVLPRNLNEIIEDIGLETHELSNLYFNIRQDSPIERAVTIQIGPDSQWTTYEVSSEDQTWAYGRYHELTDKLLSNRNLYSRSYSARPEVPQRGGKEGSWRRSSWEVVENWNVKILDLAVDFSVVLFPIIEISFFFMIFAEYNPIGKTPADLAGRKYALEMINWTKENLAVIILLNLSFAIWLVSRHYWLASLRRSKIILERSPVLSRFNFMSNSQDSVAIGTFYATVVTLVVTIIVAILA